MLITPSDIGVALGSDDMSIPELLSVATAADRLGMRDLWVTESRGRDAFVLLSQIALLTEQIGLGTGIVNVFARTPTALAQAVGTVMEAAPGRHFNLGIATGGKAMIEQFHGLPYEQPVSRLEAALEIIQSIFDNHGQVPAHEKIFATGRVNLRLKTDRSQIKVFAATSGNRSKEITGRLADGWLPIWPVRSRFTASKEEVVTAAKEAGRLDFRVAAYIYGVVSTDKEEIDLLRGTLAWYLAANGTVYATMFENYGYGAEVTAIIEKWKAGDRAGAIGGVSDKMLEDCALFGTAEEVVNRIKLFRDAGVDMPILRFPPALSGIRCVEMLEDLARAAK